MFLQMGQFDHMTQNCHFNKFYLLFVRNGLTELSPINIYIRETKSWSPVMN